MLISSFVLVLFKSFWEKSLRYEESDRRPDNSPLWDNDSDMHHQYCFL